MPRTAEELRTHDPVVRQEALTHVGLHEVDGAEHSVVEQLPHDVEFGQGGPTRRLHDEQPARPGEVLEPATFSADVPIGFSTRVALPASSASRPCGRCRWCGVATYTTSTAGSPTSSSYEPCAAGQACLLLRPAARDGAALDEGGGELGCGLRLEREATAYTCCRVCRTIASLKRCAIHPVPSTPHRSGGASIGSGVRGAGSASGKAMSPVVLVVVSRSVGSRG